MTTLTTRDAVFALMREGQMKLCAAFEEIDGAAQFVSESWERPGGGGGAARVLTEGAVFERAGVNVSAVHGAQVPPSIWQERPTTKDQSYFATGISMVLHPRNPYTPAFHANFRYFEAGDDWWFGGGMDMTPCYGFSEDAIHFHSTLKNYCANHFIANYATYKETCDDYFYVKHRKEMRGIGGIFFDNLHPDGPEGFEQAFAFTQEGIDAILNAYLPVVRRRMHTPYGERERQWQLYRRGRYVEFNLVYDRGTVFGLQTGGFIEAILMSLPPLVRWEFNYQPEPGSSEAMLADFLRPRDWAELSA
ncbi:MAG: oxygen-dependent coproporphyrinogen oxidase [Chloroflexales bacterium]|nr:oxygen-dependent coproporphyrinogen oxidase [Chloroflexales bacterium]